MAIIKVSMLLMILLNSGNSYSQFKKNIYVRAAVSKTFNQNIFSRSGFLLPIVVKNRTFLDFAVGYKVEKENGAINQYEILTYSSGHRLSLDQSLFPGHHKFSYKSYVLSFGLGYKRLWPILKNHFTKNKLFVGPIINATVVASNAFPYGYDSVRSNANKLVVGYGPPGLYKTFAKPNFNFGLNACYRVLNNNNKEAIVFSTELQVSLGRVYQASYDYRYDDVEDKFVVSNRGYLYNLSIAIPLAHFN